MPKIYNALQLKKGARAEYNRMGTITQPIQFLKTSEKDDEWSAWNLDWLEMQGLKQIRRNAKKILKNTKLSRGIIDKTDYIVEEDNEMRDLIQTLTKEDDSAFELKFFPIIPNIINVLLGEFAKRNDKITYRSADDITFNEMMEEKRSMIEEVLVAKAEFKLMMSLQEMGIELESEEGQQMMSPENIKSLPQIDSFYKKDYKSLMEQWAAHQHEVDVERFKMNELELIAFRDMLENDREFWHFRMLEDDYEIELWNPALTFYHKSPSARYISQSNYVGHIELLTVSDIIDKYGYMMSEEQLQSLEAIYPIKAAGYLLPGVQNDGGFYDPTRSHEWNVDGPSLAMRQFTSFNDHFGLLGDDVINHILQESEDLQDFDNWSLLRVTTAYWKSQRMLGHLTKIDDDGFLTQMVIDENYKVTTKPVYDTTVRKIKDKDTLIYGEHIDWIWINQTHGGIKIGPNRASFYGNNDSSGFNPIYLNCGPLPFQFKGDHTLYGCKLPVEGAVFSDRNMKSRSLVDMMKPNQIGFNLVNNQISDILIDELGTIIVLDHNTLPRHSQGEDWGRHNYAKAYVAMKDFQILPLDTTIANTENSTNFNHYQVLNMEQTNRLLSRVNLAQYFKQQAFEVVGITPERMGQINAQQTATGVEQAINNSYSQTEMYFVQHSEHLMPRVHKMRTDLAQYYHSKKPSIRLQYVTGEDEKVNFEINGTEFLLRDLNIFVSTKINQKQIMEQIRGLAINNNTAGASIFDLGNIIKADSLAEIGHVLKGIEEKTMKMREEEMEAAREVEQMRIEADQLALEAKQRFEAEENQKDRESSERIAEIRAAGMSAMVDLDQDGQSDLIDNLEYLDKRDARREEVNFKKQVHSDNQANKQVENNLKKQELEVRKEIANKQLQIAKENKNKYDKK
jgi:hypothetical protein